jgi:hypothetical protein
MTGGVRLFRLTSACSRREQDFSLAICKKQRPANLDKQTDLIIKDDNVLVAALEPASTENTLSHLEASSVQG